MQVSVIMTIYNERESIARLLESLATQTRPPDEIVICDGGSTDGTLEYVRGVSADEGPTLPPLQILVAPGVNISRGRNLAIEAAKGPIIAATDAGVRLAPNWLEQLVAPWREQGDGGVCPAAVAGFFYPDVHDPFETAMGATVLPLSDEIDAATFLPSSRSVAFTKRIWAEVGGYPEWLDYCEDLVFDFGINARAAESGSAFVWAPDAVVYFQPRSSWRSFWLQYYRYARGDGKADLWRKRHLARYLTYLVVAPALLGHAFYGSFFRWLGWFGLVVGLFFYCRRPWQRLQVLGAHLSIADRLFAVGLVPAIRVVGDVAKMVGYPVGLWWRFRHRKRSELDWRSRLDEERHGR